MVTQIPSPYASKLGIDDRRTRYDALNNKVRYLERATRTVGSVSGAGGGGGGGGGGGSSLIKIIDDTTIFTLQLLSDSTGNFTADRTLTLDMADADRILTLQGNLIVESLSTLNQDLTTDAQPTFLQVVLNSEPDQDDEAATKKYVDDNVGTTLDYFFNDTGNAIGGIYYNMTTADLEGAESTLPTAGLTNNDDQPLVNFTSEPTSGAELNTLESGIYNVHFHAERTAGNRDTNIYVEIYKRTAVPVETLLMTTELSGLVTAKESFNLHAVLAAEVELLTTDLIVIKFYANCGIGANTTIALYQEGALDSHITIHVASSVFSNLFIRQDGTTPLTADWDAGAFAITVADVLITTDGYVQLRDNAIQIWSSADTILNMKADGYIHVATPFMLFQASDVAGLVPAGNTVFAIEKNDNAFLEVLTPNNKVGAIAFSDPEGASMGYIRYAHADDSLQFWTNQTNTFALDIDGNAALLRGSLAINRAVALTRLHVLESEVNETGGIGSNTVVLVERGDHAFIEILTPTSKIGALVFSDADVSAIGRIYYVHSTDQMRFYTASTEHLTLTSVGQLQIPIVGVGAGLLIGGDTHISRGAANRLDLATGDDLNLVSGVLKMANTQVVTSQQAVIADIGGGSSDSDGTARDKIDVILAMLRVHGLIA